MLKHALKLPALRKWFFGRFLTILLFLCCLSYEKIEASDKTSSADIPFWLGIQANQQIDNQVASLLANRAAFVVLNAYENGPIERYNYNSLVRRLNALHNAPPVLIYSFATHYRRDDPRSGKTAVEWLESRHDLFLRDPSNRALRPFGDVLNPEYRIRVAKEINNRISNARAAGVAIDALRRSVQFGPPILSSICSTNRNFCDDYTNGVDMLMEEIRREVDRNLIVVNGIWNSSRGQIQEQLKLSKWADFLTIEYFGMNPRLESVAPSFHKDILPYLELMNNLPDDIKVAVFGRGSWSYTDYEEDLAWQRYLYGAYLLAKNSRTMFKFHSSFQVPAHAGRSGGLDIYSDWDFEVGSPIANYVKHGNLYTREFTKGLVVVAADDAGGGELVLEEPMYSLEGERVVGQISLTAGSADILLKEEVVPASAPVNVDLSVGADWDLAEWLADEAELWMRPLEDHHMLGEQDLMLEWKRTWRPHESLRLRVFPRNARAGILIIAEVNDPAREKQYAVVELSANEKSSEDTLISLPEFRRPERRSPTVVSKIPGNTLQPAQWQQITLHGPTLFNDTDFAFRRWYFLRPIGELKLAEVVLSGGS